MSRGTRGGAKKAAAAAASAQAGPVGASTPGADDVRVVFLGGLGEIGRNCACIEVGGKILLLDCGLMFPTPDMPGVDLVLPDFSYLRQRADAIEGLILTHGHEDHVGATPFLLRELPQLKLKIFGSALTLELSKGRLEEAGVLGRCDMIPVQDGERREIGPFDVEFIPVTHSVPHSFASVYRTPNGNILHSGDFKIDHTPVDGRRTDLARMGAIADSEGIHLLLADSTNAEEKGHTRSETEVGDVLRRLIADHPNERIIVACFASHIHRMQQVIDAAVANGRTVATLGRSMGRNAKIARQMGLLKAPDNAIIDIADADKVQRDKLLILSTGSQGEPMSALERMASGENRWIDVGEGDLVILSSHAIPGNETSVGNVINGLHRRGCLVVHSGLADVHVSGHAKQGELKTLQAVCKPTWFIPVHGEFRQMTHHANLAMEMGVPADRILLCEDGDVVKLYDDGHIDFDGEVPSGYLYVDGTVGDVGQGVLRDRRVIGEEGVVIVVLSVDVKTGEIVSGPEIITRGWVHAPDAEPLLEDARNVVADAVEALDHAGGFELESVQRVARKSLGKLVSDRTKRKPMIVPVVMEV